jgi:hypothetical protein
VIVRGGEEREGGGEGGRVRVRGWRFIRMLKEVRR